MPAGPRPPSRDKQPSRTGMAAAGIGAAILMIACCAGPVLIASGALAGIGGALGNPWLIAVAVVLVAAAVAVAVAVVVRRRCSGREACCPPAATTKHPADRDSPDTLADREGPRLP